MHQSLIVDIFAPLVSLPLLTWKAKTSTATVKFSNQSRESARSLRTEEVVYFENLMYNLRCPQDFVISGDPSE